MPSMKAMVTVAYSNKLGSINSMIWFGGMSNYDHFKVYILSYTAVQNPHN